MLLSCQASWWYALRYVSPRSSEDRVLASEARCVGSSPTGGTTPVFGFCSSGRSAVVARLVWDQEVGSSNLPAPTKRRPYSETDAGGLLLPVGKGFVGGIIGQA